MCFSVDAIIKNTSQMNWIPMIGRIACTAATIELGYRVFMDFRKADKQFNIPILGRFLTTKAGNKVAATVDKKTGTTTAPETHGKHLAKSASLALFFGTCALNQIPGAATVGLASLVAHTMMADRPLLLWSYFQKPLQNYKASMIFCGSIALLIASNNFAKLRPYLAHLI